MRAVVLLAVAACAAAQPAPRPTPGPPRQPPARAIPSAPQSPLARLEASADVDGALLGTTRAPTVVMSLASWCSHCRAELAVFEHVRVHVPRVRWVGLNYTGHEEYDGRGSATAIRELAAQTPWLRIIPADDVLFAAFGSPPKVPTIFVYDSAGRLVATFDRRERPVPDETELEQLLRDVP